MTAERVKQARKLCDEGSMTVQQIADLFGVSRPTIYRALERTDAASFNLTSAVCRTAPNLMVLGRCSTPAGRRGLGLLLRERDRARISELLDDLDEGIP